MVLHYGCARLACFSREVCTLTPYEHARHARFTRPGICLLLLFFSPKDIHIKENAFLKGPANCFLFPSILFSLLSVATLWHKPPDHRVMQNKVHAIFFSCFFFPLNGKIIQSEVANLTCSRYERGSCQLEHLLVFVLEHCWPN